MSQAPNSISIGSAVFAQLTHVCPTDRQTDRQTEHATATGRILCTVWPNNNTSTTIFGDGRLSTHAEPMCVQGAE